MPADKWFNIDYQDPGTWTALLAISKARLVPGSKLGRINQDRIRRMLGE